MTRDLRINRGVARDTKKWLNECSKSMAAVTKVLSGPRGTSWEGIKTYIQRTRGGKGRIEIELCHTSQPDQGFEGQCWPIESNQRVKLGVALEPACGV